MELCVAMLTEVVKADVTLDGQEKLVSQVSLNSKRLLILANVYIEL